jgi:hypothetical protein
MSFDGSSAVAIQKAQSIMKKPGIKNQLIYVRSNFKIICESITQLEKNGLPLTDSIKIVENVFTSLKKSPGPVAAVALKKLEDVTEKNPGYKFLLELARIFRGEDVPEHDTKMEEIYYKFAPITSCEVERSFLVLHLWITEIKIPDYLDGFKEQPDCPKVIFFCICKKFYGIFIN